MNKIKLWLVRKWLHLVPDTELADENLRRNMNKQFAAIYTEMVDGMMKFHQVPAEDMFIDFDADDFRGDYKFTGEHKASRKLAPRGKDKS